MVGIYERSLYEDACGSSWKDQGGAFIIHKELNLSPIILLFLKIGLRFLKGITSVLGYSHSDGDSECCMMQERLIELIILVSYF